MAETASRALAAGLASVAVLLLAFGAWLAGQASVSATVLLVKQAQGDPGGSRGGTRPSREVLRRAVTRLAATLGPVAGPLGSAAVKDRLSWLDSRETPEQFLARQVLLAATGLIVGVALPTLSGMSAWAAITASAGAVIGWWLPWRDLEARCRAIRRRLGREALGWADFLAAAVQAGLPLDGAIMRLARELPGQLPAMLARTVRESALTREPLDLCLSATASQIDEPHVSSVVGAIVQARQTGSDLAGPLAGLVAALRQERQQELRTAARGRSTLGAVPLIFVMLPGVMLPLAYIVFAQLRGIGF